MLFFARQDNTSVLTYLLFMFCFFYCRSAFRSRILIFLVVGNTCISIFWLPRFCFFFVGSARRSALYSRAIMFILVGATTTQHFDIPIFSFFNILSSVGIVPLSVCSVPALFTFPRDVSAHYHFIPCPQIIRCLDIIARHRLIPCD